MTLNRLVNIVVEGLTDEALVRRLLAYEGIEVATARPMGGATRLDSRLKAYNQAARHGRWLVLRDLDEESCAAALVRRLLPKREPNLLLRIAVHEAEAWLLADRKAFSDFFKIALTSLPELPEQLPDPKRALIQLASRSRDRSIREALQPISPAKVGRGYTEYLQRYIQGSWHPERAAQRSESLSRCLRALRKWR